MGFITDNCTIIISIELFRLSNIFLDFPGGSVAKTLFPVQGAGIQSLAGELDTTCCK